MCIPTPKCVKNEVNMPSETFPGFTKEIYKPHALMSPLFAQLLRAELVSLCKNCSKLYMHSPENDLGINVLI